jgi:hypothetical protein
MIPGGRLISSATTCLRRRSAPPYCPSAVRTCPLICGPRPGFRPRPTILDRVLHHAIMINIRSHSHRIEEKLQAGLVRGRRSVTGNLNPGGEFSMTITGEIWVTLDKLGMTEA